MAHKNFKLAPVVERPAMSESEMNGIVVEQDIHAPFNENAPLKKFKRNKEYKKLDRKINSELVPVADIDEVAQQMGFAMMFFSADMSNIDYDSLDDELEGIINLMNILVKQSQKNED